MNVSTANRSSLATHEIRRNTWTWDRGLGALRVPSYPTLGAPPPRHAAKAIGNLRNAPGTEALDRTRAP
jgi:hypothetical protein